MASLGSCPVYSGPITRGGGRLSLGVAEVWLGCLVAGQEGTVEEMEPEKMGNWEGVQRMSGGSPDTDNPQCPLSSFSLFLRRK